VFTLDQERDSTGIQTVLNGKRTLNDEGGVLRLHPSAVIVHPLLKPSDVAVGKD